MTRALKAAPKHTHAFARGEHVQQPKHTLPLASLKEHKSKQHKLSRKEQPMAEETTQEAPPAEAVPQEGVEPLTAPVSGSAIVGTTTLAAIFPLIWTPTLGPNAGTVAYRWSDDYGGVRTIQAYYADGSYMNLVSEARAAGGTTFART